MAYPVKIKRGIEDPVRRSLVRAMIKETGGRGTGGRDDSRELSGKPVVGVFATAEDAKRFRQRVNAVFKMTDS